MNGEDFLEVLKRIGYPGADRLDSRSFDWLFDYDATLPFLKSFCKDVQSSNVLDKKDLDEYKELEKVSKGSILSGDELDNALQRWSLIDSSSSTVTDEEISKLREELSVSRQRRDELKLLHHKLDLHHSVLVDRLSRLEGLIKTENANYQQMIEKIQRDNINMNQVLKSVETCVSQLLSLYKSLASSKQNELLISHCDMEEYHLAEEKFTQELVAFTKKQFFEGIGEIAGHNEGTEYELIEVSNPDLMLIKGPSENVILEASKDLAHLQTLYPISEAKRIDALIENRGTAAACEFQERLIPTLKDNPYPNDHQSLSAKLKAAQISLATANRDMVQLTDVKIPSQVKAAASLQSVKVLSGDYDLKLSRQDYFTANQDKVIDELTTQKSRSEFLTMALELEAKSHRDIHRLLAAITLLLQKMHKSFDARMDMMRELAKDAGRTSRTVVDSRDSFLHSIHQLISNDDDSDEKHKNKSLFVTYSQIEKNAETFSNQMASMQASLLTTDQLNHESLLSLDKELSKCDSVLYAESSTARGQPLLCPRPVIDAMDQLNGLIKKLEPAVVDIIKFVEHKKKMLEKDSRLKTERAIFTYFHNDPSQLRRCVRDIESRVEAHEDLRPDLRPS